MTKSELIEQLKDYRDDDPIYVEVDNTEGLICQTWIDTYDFKIRTEKLDEDYTEIRLKVIPN